MTERKDIAMDSSKLLPTTVWRKDEIPPEILMRWKMGTIDFDVLLNLNWYPLRSFSEIGGPEEWSDPIAAVRVHDLETD